MVEACWNTHSEQMSLIRSIFLYLDRTYVIQVLSLCLDRTWVIQVRWSALFPSASTEARSLRPWLPGRCTYRGLVWTHRGRAGDAQGFGYRALGCTRRVEVCSIQGRVECCWVQSALAASGRSVLCAENRIREREWSGVCAE